MAQTNKSKKQKEYIRNIVTKDILYKLYVEECLPASTIAKNLNVDYKKLNILIKEYKLIQDKNKMRSLLSKEYNNRSFNNILNKISKEELYKYYIIENHSYKETKEYYNLSGWTFDKLLKEYDIKKDRKISSKRGIKTKEGNNREEYYKKVLEKTRKTILKNYSSLENFYKLKGNKNKVAWEINHKDILDKVIKTKTENNSFNTSKPEDRYYQYLVQKYGRDHVFRQYKDNRYPFSCDFYIDSEDLFIELNLHWTHGGHLYNSENLEDNIILDIWKEKAEQSEFFKNAIHIWTVKDVEKYNTFIKNKLNFKIYYNEGDLYE